MICDVPVFVIPSSHFLFFYFMQQFLVFDVQRSAFKVRCLVAALLLRVLVGYPTMKNQLFESFREWVHLTRRRKDSKKHFHLARRRLA